MRKISAWLIFLNPTNLRCHHVDGILFLEHVRDCHVRSALRQRCLSHCWLANPRWKRSCTEGSEQEAAPRQDPQTLWKARGWQRLLEKQAQPCLTLQLPGVQLLTSFLTPRWVHPLPDVEERVHIAQRSSNLFKVHPLIWSWSEMTSPCLLCFELGQKGWKDIWHTQRCLCEHFSDNPFCFSLGQTPQCRLHGGGSYCPAGIIRAWMTLSP